MKGIKEQILPVHRWMMLSGVWDECED